jgi:hypothetical protein
MKSFIFALPNRNKRVLKIIGSGGRAARQRSAKPRTAVRIRSRPRILIPCESSSVGRAQPCQGWGREFESRLSLIFAKMLEFGLQHFFLV